MISNIGSMKNIPNCMLHISRKAKYEKHFVTTKMFLYLSLGKENYRMFHNCKIYLSNVNGFSFEYLLFLYSSMISWNILRQLIVAT